MDYNALRAKKERKRRRRRHIRNILLLILFFVVVAGIFLGLGLRQKYSLSDERADLNDFFNISGNEAAIIMDTTLTETKGIVENETAYAPLDFVQSNISSRFYYDSEGDQLIYVLPLDILYVAKDQSSYTLSGNAVNLDAPILINRDGINYISMDFVKDFADIEYAFYNEPARIQINTFVEQKTIAVIDGDTQVRHKGGVKSPILCDVSDGDEVDVVEKDSPWTKVHTKDGFTGYVQNKNLKKISEVEIDYQSKLSEYTSIKRDHDISLVWHQITGEAGNDTFDDATAEMSGANVIAPTWFFLNDTTGSITSFASEEYVAKAHARGMEVWGVVNDFDGQSINGGINSADETLALLSSTSARNHLVSMLISEAQRVGLDGINVDFEKVGEECGIHFTEFVRELSLQCRKNKLVLSIDNYPPVFTKHYNRAEQASVCDYIIVMAYDEHGMWSDEFGSVASIGYVKESVKDTMDEGVPADKLILGIPFYTRLWTDDASGNFSSETMSMDNAQKAVEDAGATASFDEESGQKFASWTLENGAASMIWLEDDQSIGLKMDVYRDNDLAGVAFWKLGMQNDGIWHTISDKLK